LVRGILRLIRIANRNRILRMLRYFESAMFMADSKIGAKILHGRFVPGYFTRLGISVTDRISSADSLGCR